MKSFSFLFDLFKIEGLFNVLIVRMKGDLEESLMEMLKREWEELGTGFPETIGIDEFRILMERKEN